MASSLELVVQSSSGDGAGRGVSVVKPSSRPQTQALQDVSAAIGVRNVFRDNMQKRFVYSVARRHLQRSDADRSTTVTGARQAPLNRLISAAESITKASKMARLKVNLTESLVQQRDLRHQQCNLQRKIAQLSAATVESHDWAAYIAELEALLRSHTRPAQNCTGYSDEDLEHFRSESSCFADVLCELQQSVASLQTDGIRDASRQLPRFIFGGDWLGLQANDLDEGVLAIVSEEDREVLRDLLITGLSSDSARADAQRECEQLLMSWGASASEASKIVRCLWKRIVSTRMREAATHLTSWIGATLSQAAKMQDQSSDLDGTKEESPRRVLPDQGACKDPDGPSLASRGPTDTADQMPGCDESFPGRASHVNGRVVRDELKNKSPRRGLRDLPSKECATSGAEAAETPLSCRDMFRSSHSMEFGVEGSTSLSARGTGQPQARAPRWVRARIGDALTARPRSSFQVQLAPAEPPNSCERRRATVVEPTALLAPASVSPAKLRLGLGKRRHLLASTSPSSRRAGAGAVSSFGEGDAVQLGTAVDEQNAVLPIPDRSVASDGLPQADDSDDGGGGDDDVLRAQSTTPSGNPPWVCRKTSADGSSNIVKRALVDIHDCILAHWGSVADAVEQIFPSDTCVLSVKELHQELAASGYSASCAEMCCALNALGLLNSRSVMLTPEDLSRIENLYSFFIESVAIRRCALLRKLQARRILLEKMSGAEQLLAQLHAAAMRWRASVDITGSGGSTQTGESRNSGSSAEAVAAVDVLLRQWDEMSKQPVNAISLAEQALSKRGLRIFGGLAVQRGLEEDLRCLALSILHRACADKCRMQQESLNAAASPVLLASGLNCGLGLSSRLIADLWWLLIYAIGTNEELLNSTWMKALHSLLLEAGVPYWAAGPDGVSVAPRASSALRRAIGICTDACRNGEAVAPGLLTDVLAALASLVDGETGDTQREAWSVLAALGGCQVLRGFGTLLSGAPDTNVANSHDEVYAKILTCCQRELDRLARRALPRELERDQGLDLLDAFSRADAACRAEGLPREWPLCAAIVAANGDLENELEGTLRRRVYRSKPLEQQPLSDRAGRAHSQNPSYRRGMLSTSPMRCRGNPLVPELVSERRHRLVQLDDAEWHRAVLVASSSAAKCGAAAMPRVLKLPPISVSEEPVQSASRPKVFSQHEVVSQRRSLSDWVELC